MKRRLEDIEKRLDAPGPKPILDQPTLHLCGRELDHRSPPEAKIALFRSLFRGREDVYPRRFESRRTGKTGYQPA